MSSSNDSTSNESSDSDSSDGSDVTSNKYLSRKRKGTEQAIETLFMQYISQQSAFTQRILDLIIAKYTSRANQVEKYSISAAVSEINRMVDEGILTMGSELWGFALDLLEVEARRGMFLSMRDDACRMAWLRYRQKLGK